MAKSNRALTGCGIGCGAFVLILTLLTAVGYFMVRSSIHSFKYAEQSQEELHRVYGDAEAFIPWLDGRIPSNRIETFLAVRQTMVPAAEAFEANLGKLDKQIRRFEDGERANFWNVLHTVRQGIGAIPEMAEYLRLRNEALLMHEMSLGEYAYLYITLYYAWLKKPLKDGPRFHIRMDHWGATWSSDQQEHMEEEEVYYEREKEITRLIRRMTRPMMESWLEVIDREGTGQVTGVWRERIASEIDLLREDRRHFIWAEGLPVQMKENLDLFKTRLEASYRPMANPLELMRDSGR